MRNPLACGTILLMPSLLPEVHDYPHTITHTRLPTHDYRTFFGKEGDGIFSFSPERWDEIAHAPVSDACTSMIKCDLGFGCLKMGAVVKDSEFIKLCFGFRVRHYLSFALFSQGSEGCCNSTVISNKSAIKV